MKVHLTLLLLWLLLPFSCPSPVSAQKMAVKSMVLDPSDVTANLSENLRTDKNGDYAGLLRVYLAVPGASFSGPSFLGQKTSDTSEYWVFMAKGANKLQVAAPGYQPLDINFGDHGIDGIESRRTYVLTILLPQTGNDSSKKTFTVKGVSFTMVRVEGGTFTMGAADDQEGELYHYERPAHEVTLSSFCIGETEVTQALWEAVMGKNPSHFKVNPENPVEQVSWDDCQKFVKKLSKLTGKAFRLPTEAEWEYAARGGNKSKHFKYSGSDNLGNVAWYRGNSDNKPHPVKGKSPNELGIYDMGGNVMEWCEDWFEGDYYKSSPKSDPKGPSAGESRVTRGSNWRSGAGFCYVFIRNEFIPDDQSSGIGLRLAM